MRGGRTKAGQKIGDTEFWPATDSREGKKMTKLALDQANKKILGVCGGLANWTGMDVSIIRILFVAAAVLGIGAPVLIYIALGLILD